MTPTGQRDGLHVLQGLLLRLVALEGREWSTTTGGRIVRHRTRARPVGSDLGGRQGSFLRIVGFASLAFVRELVRGGPVAGKVEERRRNMLENQFHV